MEAVAALTQNGGYLGAWSLLPHMPEVVRYRAAVEYTQSQMFNHPSIVCASVDSAIAGHYGNYHANHRTEGSELYINPLMGLYWTFDISAVAQRNLYLDQIRHTETFMETRLAILTWRAVRQEQEREWVSLPM